MRVGGGEGGAAQKRDGARGGGSWGLMRGREGQSWRPACDGDQVIGRNRQSVRAGTQWHCGKDLPGDPLAQGRGQVAYGVIQAHSLGHKPRTCLKLRIFIEKSKGSRSSAAKRLVAQTDKSACTRDGAAVLVPVKRVLPRACVPKV